jgi:hypothetical protein
MHTPNISKKNILFFTLTMGILSIISSCSGGKQKEALLIPDGYSGYLRVVYGMKCAPAEESKDGRTTIKFQDNGIALIQVAYKEGARVDNEYYYVDANGNRKKLSEITQKSEYRGTPSVMCMGYSGISGKLPDGSFSDSAPGTVWAADYVVFNGDTSLANGADLSAIQERLDSISNPMIEGCK